MLDWRGDRVKKNVIEKMKSKMNKTLSDSVKEAKRRVPVLTGKLKSSIEMKSVQEISDGIIGSFGSSLDYAIYVETGTSSMAASPYLRPAADQIFPLLSRRLN